MAGHASRTGKATGARTLFDKVFDAHVVTEDGNGQSLLWIDRHLLHEGSHHAFNKREEIKNFTAYHGTILISGILFGICFYDLHEKDFYRDGSSSTERILDFNEHVTRSGKVAFAAWLATMSSAFAGLFYVFLTDAWKKFGAPKSGNK